MTNAFGASQLHYQFQEEDGTEATATLLGTEDAPLSRNVIADSNIQLRILVNEVGGGSIAGVTNAVWPLQRSINGGAFANVTTTSTGVKVNTGSQLTDQGATTERLTSLGTFHAGKQDDQDGAVTHTHTANQDTEHVYGLTLVAADLADGDVLTFRLLYNTSTLFTATQNGAYAVTPTLNITKAAAPTEKSGTDAVASSITDAAALAADAAGADAVAVSTSESGEVPLGEQKSGSDAVAVAITDNGAVVLIEAVLPNAVIAASNLQDMDLVNPPADTIDIDDDPGAPDGDWWTAVNASVGTSCTIGFATPVGGQLVGQQRFQVWVRKTVGVPHPLANGWLRDDGGRVRQLITDVPITSESGQLLEPTWDASELMTPAGANVELELVFTAGV